MKKIRLGLFGVGRGGAFHNIIKANNGEIVAVCEKYAPRAKEAKTNWGENLAVYDNFDDFINHDGLDAVMLCNRFNEHAPFAIKCMEKGIPVLSECTSASTMTDAVALVRAYEKYNSIYMISENFPFMLFNQEMRKVYEEGTLGELLYAEGEYSHGGSAIDAYLKEREEKKDQDLTKKGLIAGDSIKYYTPYEKHWRNYLPRTYYLTHSLAPLMWITGKTPKRVSAMPIYKPHIPFELHCGDAASIILIQNDDNSVFRVTGNASFGCREDSYRIVGVNGQIENVRGQGHTVVLNYEEGFVPENMKENNIYTPKWEDVVDDSEVEAVKNAGHGGGDYFVIREFFNCIRENKKPEMDAYFGATMSATGILAHRSILEGKPFDIPDMRNEEERKMYENDTATPFWGSDGREPSICPTSDPNFKQDQKYIDAYREAITSPWSDGTPHSNKQ